MLKSLLIETPLGPVVAVGDEKFVYLVQFEDEQAKPSRTMQQVKDKIGMDISSGITSPLVLLRQELQEYFAGTLTEFKTPIKLLGTVFQVKVWQQLMNIGHGRTQSYKQLALSAGNGQASRAVGNANGKNLLVIIVPCHRVITHDGRLGGYSSGLPKKQWLLEHEKAALLKI